MTHRFLSRFRRLLLDSRGQDMVEYALLVGFVAVGAGGTLPDPAQGISKIFSKVQSIVTQATDDGDAKRHPYDDMP
jgi:Flp pilus assembly pilin Flp